VKQNRDALDYVREQTDEIILTASMTV